MATQSTAIPELPLVHRDMGVVELAGHAITAQRGARDRFLDRPDTIILSVDGGGHSGSFSTYLTPAMVVHMANAMLTDEERAAILAPALAGAGTE
jgi:hypothetical protein